MATIEQASAVYEILVADRLEQVRYAIRDIAAVAEKVARQGKPVVPLNVGDPLAFDFETPPHLIEAVNRAMRDGKNGYAPSPGLPEAIEAVRTDSERRGIQNVESVVMTYGVSEAIDFCLTALVNSGENVLVPCPDYPMYSTILAKLQAQANYYRLDESSGWQPDLDHMAAQVNAKTRAVVLVNPNNPTGATYSRQTIEAVAGLARRHRLMILSDEIYDKLILDGQQHHSAAVVAPDVPTVTFNGLSKAYLVPGWRVGWAVISGTVGATETFSSNLVKLARARLSANHPMQYAVRPALEGSQEHLPGVIKKLRARRDLTLQWCKQTPGVSCVSPGGAFYAFPRFDIAGNDEEFAKQLILEKQVSIVHGSGFGVSGGTPHFRLVFLPKEEVLNAAYQKIGDFLTEWRSGSEKRN
jgi:alanine-synthesizing transaminase